MDKNTSVLDTVPDAVLLAAADKRRKALRETGGKYATLKSKLKCPYCQCEPFGARELRRHKRECADNPNRRGKCSTSA